VFDVDGLNGDIFREIKSRMAGGGRLRKFGIATLCTCCMREEYSIYIRLVRPTVWNIILLQLRSTSTESDRLV